MSDVCKKFIRYYKNRLSKLKNYTTTTAKYQNFEHSSLQIAVHKIKRNSMRVQEIIILIDFVIL